MSLSVQVRLRDRTPDNSIFSVPSIRGILGFGVAVSVIVGTRGGLIDGGGDGGLISGGACCT